MRREKSRRRERKERRLAAQTVQGRRARGARALGRWGLKHRAAHSFNAVQRIHTAGIQV